MAPPDCAITSESSVGSQVKCALPMPSSRPATGSTDTGSISDLPVFCRSAKRGVLAGHDRCVQRDKRAHFRGGRALESRLRQLAGTRPSAAGGSAP